MDFVLEKHQNGHLEIVVSHPNTGFESLNPAAYSTFAFGISSYL